jgi:hypothetical protein
MKDLEYPLFLQSVVAIMAFLLTAALLGWLFEPKQDQHSRMLPTMSVAQKNDETLPRVIDPFRPDAL